MKLVRKISRFDLGDAFMQPLYLTFDDGPDPFSTPRVLEVLAKHEARATFFMIAEKAKKFPDLVGQIQSAGHSIGNHSLNHRYSQYFLGRKKIAKWVDESEKIMSEIIQAQTIGFRPPVGIWTPELRSVLKERKMPLILWNIRFFDTQFAWTKSKAQVSLKKTLPGSIVLLHDRKSSRELPLFLDTLSEYVSEAKMRRLDLLPLQRADCEKMAGFLPVSPLI
jgi:peptidoglycan/xylan/chitin deacetylase (PgdA/CDA1 family)